MWNSETYTITLSVVTGFVITYIFIWINRRIIGINEFTEIKNNLSKFVQDSDRIHNLFPPKYIALVTVNLNTHRSNESSCSSARWLDYTEEGIMSIKAGLNRRIELAAASSPAYSEPLKYTLVKSGKMIRSRLLILLGKCLQLETSSCWPKILILAQVIELEHAASLLHDDVVDDSDTRRGIPAHRKVFGDRTAVLQGIIWFQF